MTRKRLTVTIGYQRYVLSEEDAIRLLGIAARSTPIKQGSSYKDPWEIDDQADAFVTGAELVEVNEPEQPALGQPSSIYTAAARDLP